MYKYLNTSSELLDNKKDLCLINIFPGGSDSRVCLQCRRPGFDPWVGKIPWRRKWQPTPVIFPGKSYGWRSLAGTVPSMGSQRVGHDWANSLSLFRGILLSNNKEQVIDTPSLDESPWNHKLSKNANPKWLYTAWYHFITFLQWHYYGRTEELRRGWG